MLHELKYDEHAFKGLVIRQISMKNIISSNFNLNNRAMGGQTDSVDDCKGLTKGILKWIGKEINMKYHSGVSATDPLLG